MNWWSTAGNLFPHVGGDVVASDELCAAGGRRENAGIQQRLRVGIEQVGRNGVVGEGLSRA